MNKLPHGEAVLPLLALALSVLMFIAWPLVDMGALRRPLIGMVLLDCFAVGLDRLRPPRPLDAPGAGTRRDPVLGTGHGGHLAHADRRHREQYRRRVIRPAAERGPADRRDGTWALTANRIVGAVVVYLLFALLFALLFDLVERLSPGAFAIGQDLGTTAWTGWRFVYLSVITLSSLGLSDMTPVHPFARSLIMMEAIGQNVYDRVAGASRVVGSRPSAQGSSSIMPGGDLPDCAECSAFVASLGGIGSDALAVARHNLHGDFSALN